MPNYTISRTAAVAILNNDLLAGERFKRTPQNRTLEGVALRGSAAAGDTEIEMFIDEVRVGAFFNNALTFPNNDDLLPLESLFIPGGAELQAIVVDAAATNPINLMLALEDV